MQQIELNKDDTKEQEEYKYRITSEGYKLNWYFENRYPIWKCPNCGLLNRFVNTFGELCSYCKEEHTTDWGKYIVINEVKKEWN